MFHPPVSLRWRSSPDRGTTVSKISIAEFEVLARQELPLTRQLGVQILELEAGRARCRRGLSPAKPNA